MALIAAVFFRLWLRASSSIPQSKEKEKTDKRTDFKETTTNSDKSSELSVPILSSGGVELAPLLLPSHSTSSRHDLDGISNASDVKITIPTTRHKAIEIEPNELIIGHDRIGWGSFGVVSKGKWRGIDVAVKRCHAHQLNDGMIKDFKAEIAIMSNLAHPNILQLLGYIIQPNNLVLVSEFVPCGSLFDLLHGPTTPDQMRREAVTPSLRLNMALDICKGMHYLHSCVPAIVHRDIKSSNLLVDSNGKIKVCDFGLSRILNADYLPSTLGMGDVQYASPEVMKGGHVSEKSDVYSFGVVLWEMVTLITPWRDLRPEQVVLAVAGEGKQLSLDDGMQAEVRRLIEECWRPLPRERPSFAWLIKRLSEMKGITCLNHRSGASTSIC